MATRPLSYLTPEQYLEIERAAEVRSEYFNGEMFAMSGATARHNIVVNNLGRALYPQLKGRCRYFTTDLRLLIPSTGLYTYPDLMVICGDVQFSGDRQDIVTNPGVIVEVLSKSTADYDRGRKFVHYRAIHDLSDYLIVSQDSARLEHHSRQPDGSWLLREFTSLADIVKLPSITAEVSLAAVYEDVDFGVSTEPRL
jgi:Uma2 family endonuclease